MIFPVREIHEIEFTSRCNLACKYCPHPKMTRAKADMTGDIFAATLDHIEYLCNAGTQGEVSMTGIGEAILHPEFVNWMHMIRHTIGPKRKLVLATNGIRMTPEIARELKRNDVTVYVSLHRPEKAGPAIELLKQHRVSYGYNAAFVDSSIDWAGQVKWHVSMPTRQCEYLSRRWVAIRQDGSVNTCCMDAESLYPLGSVLDPVGSLQTHATPLCDACNLTVPQEFRQTTAHQEAQVTNEVKLAHHEVTA